MASAQLQPPASDVAISLEHVTKAFRSTAGSGDGRMVALEDINLEIRRNQFTTVVGPSGCGKSTLLRLVAGLEQPSQGRTIYKGAPVTGVNSDVGFVTQDSNLFPWLTMIDNITFPLKMRGVSKGEAREQARRWIHLVGLEGFENSYPYQLSGGMQKRASIARTLIYGPDVILMDEPFGPLDAQTRMMLQNDLLEICSREEKTILFITHDLVEAIALSDTIVLMTKGPGRVTEKFQVPLSRPRNVFEIHKQDGFENAHAQLWASFRGELGVGADKVQAEDRSRLPLG